jgi:chaperonin cofactor prefoldin
MALLVALMGFLAKEVYDNLKDAQEKDNITNEAQNAALSETAAVLQSLRRDLNANTLEIANSRQDPFTGDDGKELYKQVSGRIDSVENRVTRVEQRQQDVMIDAEKLKARFSLLDRNAPPEED